MSSWKTVSHKEDKEFRKKRNEASKKTHEHKAKMKAKRKNKAKQKALGGEGVKSTENKTNTKSKTDKKDTRNKKKGTNKKKDTNKVVYEKCEKAETKEGCNDLWCTLSHKSCRTALDCSKEKCSYIHVLSPLEAPATREECLIFVRLALFARLQSAKNPKEKAVARLTFDKFQEKISKSRYPCDAFINLRGDWTWKQWSEAMEKEHKLEVGYFTSNDLKETDLAQTFELFYNDLQEHWYIHKEHFIVEKKEGEEEKEEEEEEEEKEEHAEFDNEKIDAILKECSGKTFSQIVSQSFSQLQEDRKVLQAFKAWKSVFLARAHKALISLETEQAIQLLDILNDFVEHGKTEMEPFKDLKFEVDPVLLSIKIKCEKEVATQWKEFIKDKKPSEVNEALAKATGASPVAVGFASFPSLTSSCKFVMNIFLPNSANEISMEKYVEAVKSVYLKFPWIFSLADLLQKKNDTFYLYDTVQDAKGYGPLFEEVKSKIVNSWK